MDIREPWDDSLHGGSTATSSRANIRDNTLEEIGGVQEEEIRARLEDEDEDNILLDIILGEELQEDGEGTGVQVHQRHRHGTGLKRGFLLKSDQTSLGGSASPDLVAENEKPTTHGRIVERETQWKTQQHHPVEDARSCLKPQKEEDQPPPRKPLSKFKQARMKAAATPGVS